MTRKISPVSVGRVVSGGQTGVDQGALDAAIELGFDHGGWCPCGRLSESGPIPDQYQLVETDSSEYWVRTERNVIDSDATLILYLESLSGGTELTRRLAQKHGRPCRCVDLSGSPSAKEARLWIAAHQVRVLNVAGPRESGAPGVAELAREYVVALLG